MTTTGYSETIKTQEEKMISQARWSTTQTNSNNLGSSFISQNAGLITGNAGGQIGVDEFVFDTSSGVLASLQEPPALVSLLNSNCGCSFII